jgi:hypothetical protein
MRGRLNIECFFISFIFFSSLLINSALGEEVKIDTNLDSKVERFMESHRDQWTDWNIPEVDGKVLYDLIIQNNYKRAIDIGPVENLLPLR